MKASHSVSACFIRSFIVDHGKSHLETSLQKSANYLEDSGMLVLLNEPILNQSPLLADSDMNDINMQKTCLAWLMLDDVSVWKVM